MILTSLLMPAEHARQKSKSFTTSLLPVMGSCISAFRETAGARCFLRSRSCPECVGRFGRCGSSHAMYLTYSNDSRWWSPDVYFKGGQISSSQEPAQGVDDPEFYETERWGHFSYAVPV